MCLHGSNPESARLRRKAAVTSASSASLAGMVALSSARGHHHLLAIFVIGAQLLLLGTAVRYLVRARRVEQGSKR